MTRDDIIRMAREAGFYGSEILGEHDYDVVGLIADLERFAALVTAAKEKEVLDRLAPVISIAVSKAMISEREACAQIVEMPWQGHYREVAAQIRARGQKCN
jgi:hypothetical protein